MEPSTNPAAEATKREMYRLSQDDVMIFNPTNNDFIIEWEELRFVVPNKSKDIGWGKGKREVKRYLARWYMKHMKDKMINDMGEKKALSLLGQRQKEGKEEFSNKYAENREIWDKAPRTDDPNLIEEIYPTLFLGVTREFGNEIPDMQQGSLDTRSSEEKVMEELSSRQYAPDQATEASEGINDTIEEKVNVSEVTADDKPKSKSNS